MSPFFVHSFKEFVIDELDLTIIGDVDEVELARTHKDEASKFKFYLNLISEETRRSQSDLQEMFGIFIAELFMDAYGINRSAKLIDILEKADIFLEKHKGGKFRFEDIDLNTIRINQNRVELIYKSPNSLPDLFIGVIKGIAKILEERSFKLEKMDLSDDSTLIIFEKY